MATVLGLIGLVAFIVCVIALAAGITWLVVKISPKKENAEPRSSPRGTVASTHKPGDYETYVGPRAGSEPETRNVMWLLNRFPQIRIILTLCILS